MHQSDPLVLPVTCFRRAETPYHLPSPASPCPDTGGALSFEAGNAHPPRDLCPSAFLFSPLWFSGSHGEFPGLVRHGDRAGWVPRAPAGLNQHLSRPLCRLLLSTLILSFLPRHCSVWLMVVLGVNLGFRASGMNIFYRTTMLSPYPQFLFLAPDFISAPLFCSSVEGGNGGLSLGPTQLPPATRPKQACGSPVSHIWHMSGLKPVTQQAGPCLALCLPSPSAWLGSPLCSE